MRQDRHAAAGLDQRQHIVHRLIARSVQHTAPDRLEPEQRTVNVVVHAVRQTILPQHAHNMGLEQRAAVFRQFQRFLRAELGADLLQFAAALQHGRAAAFRHHIAEIRQRGAVVRPVAEQMHPVGPVIVVGRQLHRRDQMDALLYRMGVSVAHPAHGIVIADRQVRHSRAARQERHLFDRGRTIRKRRMGMQIARHDNSPFRHGSVISYYTLFCRV